LLAITFGLLSSACLIICSLSLSRKRILIASLLINTFSAAQYLLLSQTGALVMVSLGFIMAATVLASLKFPALGTAKVLGAFLVAYPIAFFSTSSGIQSAFELLPLFSTMIATTAVFMRNLLVVKTMFILNGLSWLAFEIFAGAYGAVPGEILTLAGNVTSFILLGRAHLAGQALETVPEMNVRIAGLIRKMRGSIPAASEVIAETPVKRELVNA
jgi:hypothetical protein